MKIQIRRYLAALLAAATFLTSFDSGPAFAAVSADGLKTSELSAAELLTEKVAGLELTDPADDVVITENSPENTDASVIAEVAENAAAVQKATGSDAVSDTVSNTVSDATASDAEKKENITGFEDFDVYGMEPLTTIFAEDGAEAELPSVISAELNDSGEYTEIPARWTRGEDFLDGDVSAESWEFTAAAGYAYGETLKDALSSDGAVLPWIAVKTKTSEGFLAAETVDDMVITVSAPEGVFPEGAVLSVRKVENRTESKKIDEAVAEAKEENASAENSPENSETSGSSNVAATFTYDIKVLFNGEEIEPDNEKGTVSVSFAAPGKKTPEAVSANVYHVKDHEESLTAEKLEVSEELAEEAAAALDELDVDTEEDTVISVETDGFSYYVVEFTYDSLQYVLPGSGTALLSEILNSLGITGTVSEAEVSNPDLFTAEKNTDGVDWIVTSKTAFSSDEWLKVTVDGFEYIITVTDSEINVITEADGTKHFTGPNPTWLIDETTGKVTYRVDNFTVEDESDYCPYYYLIGYDASGEFVRSIKNSRIKIDEITENGYRYFTYNYGNWAFADDVYFVSLRALYVKWADGKYHSENACAVDWYGAEEKKPAPRNGTALEAISASQISVFDDRIIVQLSEHSTVANFSRRVFYDEDGEELGRVLLEPSIEGNTATYTFSYPTAAAISFTVYNLADLNYAMTSDKAEFTYKKVNGVWIQVGTATACVTYKMNGGVNNSENPNTLENGEEVTLKDPTRTGYTFDGWYSDAGFTNRITSIKAEATDNITVYAKWLPNTYTITWKNWDGTVIKTDAVTYGTTPVYSGSTPVKATDGQYNYIFVGWTPEIASVSGAAEYTAVFTAEMTPEDTKKQKTYEFVKRLYSKCLGREADEDGLAYWYSVLSTGQVGGINAAYGFIFSDEFKDNNYCNEHFVKYLYEALMGRSADEGGLNYWVGLLDKGTKREVAFNSFASSEEFKKICADAGINPGSTVAVPTYGTVPYGPCEEAGCGETTNIVGFAMRMYEECLKRPYDPEGLAYWSKLLYEDKTTAYEITRCFFLSDEIVKSGIDNKEYVRRVYKTMLDREPDEGGWAYWEDAMNCGAAKDALINGFVDSDEFTKICSDYGIRRK